MYDLITSQRITAVIYVTARLEIAGDHEVLTIAIERDVLAREDLVRCWVDCDPKRWSCSGASMPSSRNCVGKTARRERVGRIAVGDIDDFSGKPAQRAHCNTGSRADFCRCRGCVSAGCPLDFLRMLRDATPKRPQGGLPLSSQHRSQSSPGMLAATGASAGGYRTPGNGQRHPKDDRLVHRLNSFGALGSCARGQAGRAREDPETARREDTVPQISLVRPHRGWCRDAIPFEPTVRCHQVRR